MADGDLNKPAVDLRDDQGIWWITLNRPEASNAFTLADLDRPAQIFDETGYRPRAVVLTGAGSKSTDGETRDEHRSQAGYACEHPSGKNHGTGPISAHTSRPTDTPRWSPPAPAACENQSGKTGTQQNQSCRSGDDRSGGWHEGQVLWKVQGASGREGVDELPSRAVVTQDHVGLGCREPRAAHVEIAVRAKREASR